ncbi:MAG: hypothetical protein ABEH38_04090 [Flavobacteriales bacterium]
MQPLLKSPSAPKPVKIQIRSLIKEARKTLVEHWLSTHEKTRYFRVRSIKDPGLNRTVKDQGRTSGRKPERKALCSAFYH